MACGLSRCGAGIELLCSMWNLLGSGIEPVFPALAGGFLSTAPPGKSLEVLNVFNTRQGFGPFYPRLTTNEVLKVLFVKHVSSE